MAAASASFSWMARGRTQGAPPHLASCTPEECLFSLLAPSQRLCVARGKEQERRQGACWQRSSGAGGGADGARRRDDAELPLRRERVRMAPLPCLPSLASLVIVIAATFRCRWADPVGRRGAFAACPARARRGKGHRGLNPLSALVSAAGESARSRSCPRRRRRQATCPRRSPPPRRPCYPAARCIQGRWERRRVRRRWRTATGGSAVQSGSRRQPEARRAHRPSRSRSAAAACT